MWSVWRLASFNSTAARQRESAIAEAGRIRGSNLSNRVAFSFFALVALACIFFVPYMIPVKPAVGLSYAFGFNNNAGILLLLSFCTAGALWQRRKPLFLLPSGPDILISRRTLATALLVTSLFCALAYPLLNRATPVADAAYFVQRMQLVHAGKLPYINFEFAYGPMLVYLPLWIAELFRIPFALGYYIFWVVTGLAGVVLLARFLNAIDIPTPTKPAIFMLFCAAFCATFIIGGANYTFFRFAIAPFLALEINQIDLKWKSRRKAAMMIASLVVLSFAFLEFVSPEIAIAFGLGYVCFLLFQWGGNTGSQWITLVCSLLGMSGMLWIANRAHVLDTLKAFGGGARSYPFVLSVHLVFFMLCAFLAALHLFRSWPRWGESSSCLVIFVSVPMMVSALSSCDPLHVFYSGLGLLAIGMMYLGRSKLLWDSTRIVFAVFFVFAIFAGLALERENQYFSAIKHPFGPYTSNVQLSQHALFPQSHGILQAPFGFRSSRVEMYDVSWVHLGRFFGMINAPSVQDVLIKERELEAHPQRELLIPAKLNRWHEFSASHPRLWLEVEFLAPYSMPIEHPVSPDSALVDYVEQHYHRVASFASQSQSQSQSQRYEIWARN
jgi:hypothetical protein